MCQSSPVCGVNIVQLVRKDRVVGAGRSLDGVGWLMIDGPRSMAERIFSQGGWGQPLGMYV